MAIATTNRKINRADSDNTFLGSIKKLDMKITVPRKISAEEIMFFTNQLFLMLDIGTALNISLSSISGQIKNPSFKKVIADITDQVEGGHLLSDALGRHPRIFSDVYVSLVKAGENTGQLKEMLERVVELHEKQKKFVSMIKKSLTYPGILCFMSVAVVLFLLAYVFPRFANVFEQIEDVLPASTKLLMFLSNSLRSYWPAVMIITALICWGIYMFIRSEKGKLIVDRLKISAPLVANIYMKIYLTMTMRTLGFLMGSNISLIDALMIARRGTSNVVFAVFIDKITENVKEGRGMTPAFAQASFIPDTVKQMVKTGEESQNVSKVMLRLSDYYEGETDNQLKKFASIVEPLLLVIMGVVVGGIVTSIILPIFRMSSMAH
jgi:type II secretory pathway component PulF